jgi:hypothetical protein
VSSDVPMHLKLLRPNNAQDRSFDHVVGAKHTLQTAFQHLNFIEPLIVFVRFLRQRQLDALEQRIRMRAKNSLQSDGMKTESNPQMDKKAAVDFS